MPLDVLVCAFDNGNILQGYITSLPKHHLDAMPIQLACQNKKAYVELESNDCQNFEFLWELILRVAEYMKIYPPSMTKYQQNFHLMIEDVMKHHGHLFTDDDKLFLGIL